MSTIDSRVVEMKFDNAQFEAGVRSTLSSLSALNKGLKLDGAAKGLNDVSNASKRFSLQHISSGVDTLVSKFSTLSVVGVAALATLASRATSAGLNIAKSLTISPVTDGFHEYETQLNAVQTILANTQAAGTKLSDVNSALQQLNTYSDKTIYNFSEMAKNIGTFTAAGVDLDTSVASIKGIANLAALSGSNSQQASTAMYQLSQAISSGRVSLEDWNSVVNAGMGGTVFQRALAQTAENMGTLDKGAVKLTGKMKNATINGKSFRESITAKPGEKSWLTSDVLTNTLKQFTGDLSDAQLKAQGFSAAQIKAIQAQAKTAQSAATEVKTASQLMGTLQEAVGSGWAQTWQIVFGDFGEAKALFTGVSNVLGGFITASSNARNKVLGDWAKLGGRVALIDTISMAFKLLLSVMKPIKEAFQQIFPPVTGQQLYNLTERLFEFVASLKMGADTAKNLKRTFAGVFAIFSIIGQILGGAVGMIASFFGAIAGGTGSFLNFTGGIGDFLVSLDQMLKKTGIIKTFFSGLGSILAVPVKLLGALGKVIGGLFSGFKAPDLGNLFGAIGNSVGPLDAAGKRIQSFFTSLWNTVKNFGSKIAAAIGDLGSAIGDAFSNMDFSRVFSLINTGLLGGIVLLLKKFFSGGGFSLNIGGGIFDAITGGLDQLTGTLTAMQSNIKADTIMKIAMALGILAGSMLLLSTIDGSKMAVSLAGLAGAMAILQGALMAINSTIGFMGTLKLPALTLSLGLLAGSLLLMSLALKVMASIPGDQIVKGLAGIGGSLLVIAGAMQLMPKDMVLQSVAIGILALSLTALAGAVALFATIGWEALATGLGSIGASLLVLAAAMRLMPKDMVLQAVAIGILATALNALAGAVMLFSSMSLAEIGTGLLGIAGSLLVIAGAMALMPPTMLLTAAGLVAVGVALNIIGLAVQSMGGMSMEEIGKGLLTLAGSLLILAGGLALMSGALPGAAALLVAAGALAVFVPVLAALGMLPVSVIVTGLLALAATFAILGVAGMLLAPLAPIILALGAAILMIGAGFALAGAGALALSAAFYVLVAAVSLAVNTIVGVFKTLATMTASAMVGLAKAVIAGAAALARGGPAFTAAATTIVRSILTAITNNIPRVGALFTSLVNTALRVLTSAIPRLASAGLQMITRLLSAISQRVPQIVTIASNLAVRFLNTLAGQMGRITQAGANLIVAFLNGLSRQVPRIATAATNLIIAFMRAISANMGRITAEGTRLAQQFISGVARGIAGGAGSLASAAASVGGHIASGMARGVAAGIGSVVGAAKRMASSALSAAKGALGIHSPSKEFEKVGKYVNEGFAKGLHGSKAQVHEAYKETRDLLSEAMKAAAEDVKNAQAKLSKLTKARHKDTKAIKATRKQLAQAHLEEQRATSARNTMDKYLRDDRNKLGTLAAAHDVLTKKIEDGTKKLADAKKTRDDYNKSIRNELVDTPDISADTKLPDYIGDLQKSIIDTQRFGTVMQKLRGMGLNDYFYKEFLSKGPEALPFLDQIVARGKNGVDELNTLGSALYKSAASIGDTASKNLYQAAVDSAAGLVKGLQSQQKNIEKQMDHIADYMVNAIKKKLGIHSPSREFAKIGGWSVEGLAQGLKNSGAADKAAGKVGTDAILAMRKSLSGLSSLVDGGVDMNPTITPVLDLSDVQKKAGQIGSMLPTGSISVGSAYSTAKAASAGYKANQTALAFTGATTPGSSNVTFIQNNTSPKALSEATIYRQSKNQISMAKGVLTRNA